MTSALQPASTQGAMMLVTLCLCCLWRGCKPYRENLQPEFSSSHWACLASDCPLLERCIFPSSVGRKFPESQHAVPLQSPTAVTSRGTPKGTCRVSHGPPGAPRLAACPHGGGPASSLAPL